MCGIIGITGRKNAPSLILDGLRRLEYRGYDSAGIATIHNGAIERVRAQGKLHNLEVVLNGHSISGTTGIGHTRWATHGAPNEANAHPHATDKVAVVHNGIIENFRELKSYLEKEGYKFKSETDTEVIPLLITHHLKEGMSPGDAVAETLSKLVGAFALAIIFSDHEDLLIAARRGSPLAIGYGDGEMYAGSDALALAPFTSRICYLDEGDWAEITPGNVTIYNANNQKVEREVKLTSLSGASVGKGNFRHFMQKEIFEQPSVMGDTLSAYYNAADSSIAVPTLPISPKDIAKIQLIACGTSYYAAMVGKYWLEQYAKIPTEVDIASEFRYRETPLGEKTLCLFISQSGETADTLAALKMAKAKKLPTLAIVNALESSMAQEAALTLYTHAGPEIGVASTKAFTTQLVTLAALTLSLADARGAQSKEQLAKLAHALAEAPAKAAEILHHDERIAALAPFFAQATDILYMGRGSCYPIALEGALKLKEISYIHAEGYAAGELKHGPIALIDKRVPIIVIAPSDALFEKTASNMQEAIARGGKVVLISDAKGLEASGDAVEHSIKLPPLDAFIAPILYAIPIQLIAYHTAVAKGTDVDQPRNLAKSVTVE